MKLFSKETKIRCHAGEEGYDIVVGANILPPIGKRLQKITNNGSVIVVTNAAVGAYYAPLITSSLRRAGYTVVKHIVPDGERAKSDKELFRLLGVMVAKKFERSSTVIALGGGVVGDLAGFAASIYMRGVNFVNIPTSLLAQVDSAVGGKTGINLKEGKNLVGTFYQPKLVIADIATLATLPEEEMLTGLAEVIKYGVICDGTFFDYLETHIREILDLDLGILEKAVSRCVRYKVSVVEKDEKENGLRAILNFGHTFAHAFEQLGNYKKLSHGMAVALGMQAAAGLAHTLGMFDAESFDRLITIIEKTGLPTSVKEYGFTPQAILRSMYSDKKVKNKKLRLVLPLELGSVVIRDDIDDAAVKNACNF